MRLGGARLTQSALLMGADVSHGLFGRQARLVRAAAAAASPRRRLDFEVLRVLPHPFYRLVGTSDNFQSVRADKGEGTQKIHFEK